MSKRTIYLIVGLIISAIVGVIWLQLEMIQTAMEVNAQRYDEAVQDALKFAANEQEVYETALVNNQINGYTERLGRLSGKLPTTGILDRKLGSGLSSGWESNAPQLAVNNRIKNQDLEERVNRDMLHKDLTTQFINANLDRNLAYGVFDVRKQEFIIRNGRPLSKIGADTARHSDLMNSSYRVSLFDDKDGQPRGYIIAYSPEKDDVIFDSIWYNLALSFLFVSIILGCFIYTIYVILFQKKLSEMKTDFINNMTHEFKTPIATISLATDSIVSPKVSSDPDKVQRFARIIKQENKRMNDQVEKVLQMAKLDKNKLKLNISEVDLNDVVTDAAVYIGLQVEPRGGTVETDLQAEPAIVQGDLTHISSLINNLLDNANKYSPESPKILVSTRNVSKGVEVTVKDHGLGMTREARKNIFDRFYRVHTGDRHDVKGFGLGLSYVKTITEVHNGTINVKSEIGKGSSFIVTFPYLQD
ncbi:HAMP domain-containing histidine kinase [Neolewinella aurantiaca]|uniref:histidine kinase n=1 Tax=Neolewinella aurantiaca TaxID=2602767 RepID=A0A5C7FIA1_9BACT|nr:HAMP domain-containing sensor histidine kinase [Neolewinella aurantiaca]TXF89559.1 HAMP domain-containing histidine kinase [Neolewinella aurantiaca]